MEHPKEFRYRPECSAPGCDQDVVYKIGASWSDGVSRELKNYGLACAEHCDALMARAKLNRGGLKLAAGETLGEIRRFQFHPDRLDVELEYVSETPAPAPAPA